MNDWQGEAERGLSLFVYKAYKEISLDLGCKDHNTTIYDPCPILQVIFVIKKYVLITRMCWGHPKALMQQFDNTLHSFFLKIQTISLEK